MTTKQSTKKVVKGKADSKREAVTFDETTDVQFRAIVTDPNVKQGVKDRLDSIVGNLGREIDASTLPDIPETAIAEYEAASRAYLYDEEEGALTDKARRLGAQLVEYVERHEPKDAVLVRRLDEKLDGPQADNEFVNRLGYLMCELSNELQISDLHPEVFKATARLLVREGRKVAAVKVGGRGEAALQAWMKKHPRAPRPWMLKKYLRELEALADGKGGAE